MDTPIYDFVEHYRESDMVRMHMPGHKGVPVLGCEPWDITEVGGADELYAANGIIARSEENASAIFGTGATFYSTEGSSQCIRAMLALALRRVAGKGQRPVIVAARNAHKTLVLAAALLDFDICWLWPEEESYELCRCPVSAMQLRRVLESFQEPPAAVYITSPDYLGSRQPLKSLAETAHHFNVLLLVDNAHGAYLHFLREPSHPMDLGADLCCDSAHKTLPVLTGGAYLHVSKTAPAVFAENARQSLALFGSTSPSYLILQSLDLANRYLSQTYPERLRDCVKRVDELKSNLHTLGWSTLDSDPLKLTICAAQCGWNGEELADVMRSKGIECEYADPDFVVLMLTPETSERDFLRLQACFAQYSPAAPMVRPTLQFVHPNVYCSIRHAVFAPCEMIPVEKSVGRVLAQPTVGCPPAVPVLISGEVVEPDSVPVFTYYHMETISVIKE